MDIQKLRIGVAAFVAMILSPSTGFGFTNLNFEGAIVVSNDPIFGFLDWDLAAPGWGHSGGSATDIIYYENTHIGTDQIFLLRDRVSPQFGERALSGEYSLSFVGGDNGNDPANPYVDAYISQTGDVPDGSRSLQLLARGPFDVFLGGTQITMMDLGGDRYGGNIPGFAGTRSELMIVNTARENIGGFTIVDDIEFSPEPVPEPSAALLVLAGLALVGRRRRG